MFELRTLHNGRPLLFGGDFFDGFAERPRNVPARSAAALAAPADIRETATAIRVVLDLPGVAAEQIAVNFKDDALTIEAERAAPAAEGETVIARERAFGKVKRTFAVNVPVDGDQIQAAYDNGVLTVTLPKRPEPQPHKITVAVKK